MDLIVGLGNPGSEYAATRHNIGFRVIDRLARILYAAQPQRRWAAEAYQVEGGWLLKPMTYMNDSGRAVGACLRETGAVPGRVLVIADDLHMPLGRMRCRGEGSSGGHNGLASVARELGTEAFARLRLGIGSPDGALGDGQIGFVLGAFSPQEEPVVADVARAAAEAALVWRSDGVQSVQQRYNGWRATPVPVPETDGAAEKNRETNRHYD